MSADFQRFGGEPRYYGPPRRTPHPVKSENLQRASDAEREAVVEQLRLNCSEGRLSMDEFGDRTTQALAARTGGDLRAVLADLPIVPVPTPPAQVARRRHVARVAVLTPYVVVNVVLILIWAVTGFGYFWPIWPILGWGIGVVLAVVSIGRPDSSGGANRFGPVGPGGPGQLRPR